jgi:two-component system cell cycle response regulator DivK
MLATMLHNPQRTLTSGHVGTYMRRTKSRAAGLPPTILVVDDDPDSRLIYSEYLRAHGWLAFTAADGRSALDKIEQLSPDAVVLDLAMPRVDGWTVLKQLRDSSWTAGLPVVVLTASNTSREGAFEAGCNAFLLKPCPPDTLLNQLRGLFQIRSTARVGRTPPLEPS